MVMANIHFPFSPPIINKKIFYKEPKRGDLVVFKLPSIIEPTISKD